MRESERNKEREQEGGMDLDLILACTSNDTTLCSQALQTSRCFLFFFIIMKNEKEFARDYGWRSCWPTSWGLSHSAEISTEI